MSEDARLWEFLARNEYATQTFFEPKEGCQTFKANLLILPCDREATKTHEPITLLKDSLFKDGPDPRGNVVIGSPHLLRSLIGLLVLMHWPSVLLRCQGTTSALLWSEAWR